MWKTVKKYWEIELAALGYPTDNIQASLGYSQGDGMAFYGSFDNEGLEKLANRLLDTLEERVTFLAQLVDGTSAQIEEAGMGRYHHWNTMRFEHDLDVEVGLVHAVWQLFASRVAEDIQAVSQRLEAEGYAILQAASPRWYWQGGTHDDHNWAVILDSYVTPLITVEITLSENDHLDGYEFGEQDKQHAVVKRMAAGELKVAKICCHATLTDAPQIDLDSEYMSAGPSCVEDIQAAATALAKELAEQAAERWAELRQIGTA